MIVQCMMPDESERIRQTAVMTMLDLLLMLSVFNPLTLPEDLAKNHPSIAVVFNHVSKYENPAKSLERKEKYRLLVLEKAYEIYCLKISDATEIGAGGFKWKDIKHEILESNTYKEEEWFKNLSDFDA